MDDSFKLAKSNNYGDGTLEMSAMDNGDNTFSVKAKLAVEALPISNTLKTISSTAVPLTANTVNKFLAIKNNGSEAINLRLATVNLTPLDNKDIFLKLEIKNSTDVTGTFTAYTDSTISEYSVNPTFTTNTIPTYPNVDINTFGITINQNERLNLFSGDVIVRIEPGKVLCFSAVSKNTTSFNFFIRHIEEY